MNDDQTTYGVFANEEGELPLPERKELSAKIREQSRALASHERALRNVHMLVQRMKRTDIPGALDHLERFCVEAMPELAKPKILRGAPERNRLVYSVRNKSEALPARKSP